MAPEPGASTTTQQLWTHEFVLGIGSGVVLYDARGVQLELGVELDFVGFGGTASLGLGVRL